MVRVHLDTHWRLLQRAVIAARSIRDDGLQPRPTGPRSVKLFAALKEMRDFERLELPFIQSLIDFDIVIEVGYAEEMEGPLTPKALFLMKIGSVTTVRRRLVKLTEKGIVKRRTDPNDRRSDILTLSPSSHKLLGKYGGVLSVFSLSS